MQVKYAIEAQLRRAEFVERALFFEAEIVKEVEPVHLSTEARSFLADCNPDLPEVFKMLEPGHDIKTAPLWQIKINPNAYATVEIIELWAKEFGAALREKQDEPPATPDV